MCMFCAAVPLAAASGIALDNRQRRKRRAEGHPEQRIRPFLVLTVIAILLLMLASVYAHVKFSRYF